MVSSVLLLHLKLVIIGLSTERGHNIWNIAEMAELRQLHILTISHHCQFFCKLIVHIYFSVI